MNNEIFQHARQAYEAKDYERALQEFTNCLQDTSNPLAPGEMGLLYHQIGNSLVKLNDYNEAIHAYTQSSADTSYDASGTVSYNLGMSYAALHDYENAVRNFEIAVSDAKYDTPYKAYSAMGNALLKLGKSAEAGVAFRQSALDDKNPDPTKALLNLGICFMALDRPSDAVSSYESALPFDMSQDTKNKLFANLGQAYVAAGQMQNAVTAFETALSDKTYYLNDSASVDYQRAIAAVATGSIASTGTLAPLDADTSGLDVSADGTSVYSDEEYNGGETEALYYPQDNYGVEDGYATGGDRFFNASDEELEQWSKGLAKQQRKHRNVVLKVIIAIFIVLLLLFGVAAFGYTQGYGFPSQESVVEELFADPDSAGEKVFAHDLSESAIQDIRNQIVKDPQISIQGMNKSMSETKVYVNAKTPQAAEVTYEVKLVRDMIGWKVADAELYYASQH